MCSIGSEEEIMQVFATNRGIGLDACEIVNASTGTREPGSTRRRS
jgi:hypothetical protein